MFIFLYGFSCFEFRYWAIDSSAEADRRRRMVTFEHWKHLEKQPHPEHVACRMSR